MSKGTSTGVIVYDVNSLQESTHTRSSKDVTNENHHKTNSTILGPLANAFLILVNALFFNVQVITKVDDYPQDKSSTILAEENPVYDFVIVGAGTAGCVLANRLSEHEQFSVLLIEAGDYPQASSAVPQFFPTFLTSTMDTWKFQLELDKKTCQSYRDKKCWITRGKMLGGTSSMNNLHYFRGVAGEYESFGNLTTDMFDSLEYFHDRVDLPMKGEIYLSRVTSSHPKILTALKEGYRDMGSDANTPQTLLGFSDHLLTIKDGQRVTMSKAFLYPVKNRSNFFLMKNAVVEGIVTTEPTDKRAKGVNVTVGNANIFIQARKEVILTAGAINNAKLLLLSGIGPEDYLEKKNIPLVVNAPGVGKNLKMHISVPIFVGLESFCETCENDIDEEHDLINNMFDYLIHKKGNLSNTGVNHFVNYISTDQYPNIPNIGIYHVYFQIKDRMLDSWLSGFELQQKIINNVKKVNSERAILMFLPTLLKPKSNGEILLNDTHYQSNPQIYGNFFTDEENQDLTSLIQAVGYVSNLTETKSLKGLNAEILNVGVNSCNNYKFCSLHYVKCYVKHMVTPTSNVVGTVKRGPECDKTAVVKPDMEVKHVRCLRVADSSVLPESVTGNTVAVDAMLGIKTSEYLKEKWIKHYESPFKSENPQESVYLSYNYSHIS